jgi:DNA repair protein RecN (Recombination protein N)
LGDIETEIARLSSVEELRTATAMATAAIEDEEAGALTSLGTARRSLENARAKDRQLEEIYQQLSDSFFLLADAQSALNSYLSRLEADPVRLDFLQQRKSGFVALVKKFGSCNSVEVEIEALHLRFKNSEEAIADLEGGDARLQELEKELTAVKKTLLSQAKKLSELRTTAAQKLSDLVTQEIQQLSML